jgi:hypothetical protein
MSAALLLGVLAGLATIGVSEIVLKLWRPQPGRLDWKPWLIGMALRAAWVLGLLVLYLGSERPHRAAFALSLLAGYLLAQIFEGLRYQRAASEGRLVRTK